MKKDKFHLPFFGVGPLYVLTIIGLTIAAYFVSKKDFLNAGIYTFTKIPFSVIGILLIVFGIFLWIKAVIFSKITSKIKQNCLVTAGVYAWVRNPIYSACMFCCWGCLLFLNNIFLLLLAPTYWIFLTVLMKNTEEKWLLDLYKDEYIEYCKKVNRCIPCIKL